MNYLSDAVSVVNHMLKDISPGDPDSMILAAKVYRKWGMELFEKGEKKRAIHIIRQAIAFNPSDHVAYHNLAVVHKALGNTQFAEGLFSKSQDLKNKSGTQSIPTD